MSPSTGLISHYLYLSCGGLSDGRHDVGPSTGLVSYYLHLAMVCLTGNMMWVLVCATLDITCMLLCSLVLLLCQI